MPNPTTAAEWAKIEARHVKVEDVIFDGPVCRTCRHIDGAAVSYPCDAAVILEYARERVEAFRERAAQEMDEKAKIAQVRYDQLAGVQPESGLYAARIKAFKEGAAALRALEP